MPKLYESIAEGRNEFKAYCVGWFFGFVVGVATTIIIILDKLK